jgi:predicted TPR repeat methyltransferase
MQKLQAATDADALARRAAQLMSAGRLGAARPLLAAARRLTPGALGLADLTARLALLSDTPEAATEELDAAIAAAPEHAGLRMRRAELRRDLGDLDGATRDAAEAVVLDRGDPVAKALLGVLMLDLHRHADAIACLAEAVADVPANPAFVAALAAAQEAAGAQDAALATLQHGIAGVPGAITLHNAAILLCVRRRDFQQAIRLAEAARQLGIADACSFGLLGHALSSLGNHAAAGDAYAEALKLGPQDSYVRHLVAASGVVPGATRAPLDYLRTVFNGYADRFEHHLIGLGYRVPGLIRAALCEHPRIAGGAQLGPVLDLGCGTGLVALAIADLPVGPLIGIDAAPRMLQEAAAKGLYAALHEADIMVALTTAEAAARYPLILAGDVFCYFGELHGVLAAANAALTPGGWLVFSVEELLPDHDGVLPGDNGAWALQRQGRYAHSADYIREVAAAIGYAVLRLDRETLRREADSPTAGLLVVLQQVRHDG